jgi:hypothetical protein
MRRLIAIPAFALFLALPLWAQHGGGHAGGGHGGGFAGHASFSGGHGGGGHVSGGMHSGSGPSRSFHPAPSFSPRGSSRGLFLHDGFHGNHFRGSHNRFVTFGFRNNCFTFGCRRGVGYPWAYGGYYDPYWWWDSGSSYDEDYERDRATANEMNQQSLEQQRMLRQEEADGDQDVYARSGSGPRPAPREASAAMLPDAVVPDTVLVFRDQHKQEIRNYAIVGQTLWTFSSQRTEKIPLATLDLAATTKANDDRGLTFRVPDLGEGQ